MELPKAYAPDFIEDKWYQRWIDAKLFESKPDHRTPYTIVIPPPNVTGVLHMGHMLNNTIQDVLIRRARMLGYNACWVPGTDHASIATEAKVVQMLRDKGIKKSDLSREAFLQYAWEWKEKYGGIILEQLKKLGASCDWSRTRFTMEPKLSEAVLDVFIDLHKKGLIYRGLRMINWDPSAKTTLSNEEVIYKTEENTMYYIKYVDVNDPDQFITVATVRPETIMGDVAVCVNPNDERYSHWIGKKVRVPMVNREVPVIADNYVDIDFGTGALKITPAHDINDYEIGLKHGLEVIDCFEADGKIAPIAGIFVGQDRFEARKSAASYLAELALLIKTETIQNTIGRSERTNAVVEPRLSMQWFVDMKAFFNKNPEVLDHVMDDTVAFWPPKFKNTYKNWIDNIKDWCISRQLWWGQRIPAWYNENGALVAVCKTLNEAQLISGESNLHQDDDVLDTWFSSWLWPISVFDGFENPNNEDINYYYPTNDLVTAPEIMFFWVMRMIMAGYEWKGKPPFKNVYYTGIVRDKQRRKMSKSLGNSPDPLDLIAKYGADGVRMGMLLCSPAGNDILFDEALCEQGRNFSNKIWNANKLITSWAVDENVDYTYLNPVINWFEAKMNQTFVEIEDHFAKFRLSEALMTVYKLVWDDFCATYLEMVKPPYGEPIAQEVLHKTKSFFEQLLRLLHPFMPFVTEELWQNLNYNINTSYIAIAAYPLAKNNTDTFLMKEAEPVLKWIQEIRNIRAQKQISPKEKLEIEILNNETLPQKWIPIMEKMGNAALKPVDSPSPDWYGAMADTLRFWINLTENIDIEAEIEKLKKELVYQQGFKIAVEKKLSNERFVAGAPAEVVANEKKKLNDALLRISAIEDQLARL